MSNFIIMDQGFCICFNKGEICVKRLIIFLCLILITLPSECFAVETSARSAIIIESRYGNVLYEKNAHTRATMASTTKIMTALCAIEEGNLDSKVKVHDSAVGVEGSSMYLTRGEEITLRELVYGLMLSSGNDAAVAIACAVSGSVEDFAKLMNDKAERIGAKNTQFKNPNGLDEEGHYTTAYDLAKIAAHAMKNEEFRKIVSTYQTTVSSSDDKRYLTNHNKLLKMMDGCIGVKTGFTKKSGRCLVSACERDGMEVVAVTLNAPDDWNDHMAMTDYAYTRLCAKTVAQKGESFGYVGVKKGTSNRVEAVCSDTFWVPAVSDVRYVSVYEMPKSITAPVKAGSQVGTLKVYMDSKVVASVPVVAKESVSEDKTRHIGTSIDTIIRVFLGKS